MPTEKQNSIVAKHAAATAQKLLDFIPQILEKEVQPNASPHIL